MNLSVVNQNNSESVVLPPRMNDLYVWYTADSSVRSSGDISQLYDMSMNGNGVTSDGGSANYPSFTAISGDFNGYRTIQFGGSDIISDDFVVSEIFGSIGSWESDPTFTVAGVLSEDSNSADTEHYLRLYDDDGDGKLYLGTRNTDVMFRVEGSDADTTGNSSPDLTADTPTTFVFTIRSTTPDNEVVQWYGGSKRTFDDETEVALSQGEMEIDKIKFAAWGWDGNIAEILIFDGGFTDAEASEITSYLSDKWNCS